MEIIKINPNGLQLKTKTATIALDPALDSLPASDVILVTSAFLDLNSTSETQKIFSWPGEFEVRSIGIKSFVLNTEAPLAEKKLAFLIYSDELKVAYIPSLDTQLSPSQVEQVGEVDLLIMPLLQNETLLHNLLEEIGPRAILPILNAENQHLTVQFFQKLGLTAPESLPKLSIAKKDLSEEQMTVFMLS